MVDPPPTQELAMGLMDKVKETAQKGADAAKGAVNAGQEKLDDLKVEKKIKELKEELGGLLYAQKTGSPADNFDTEVARIVAELQAAEQEQAAG
jgi:hypothetical protein